MSPSTTFSHRTRRTLYTVVALLVVAALLAGLLGFGDLFGAFVGLLQFAVLGVALYLFYRFVLAVERIARALEGD